MSTESVPFHLPESVRKDVLTFRSEVERFKCGEISPIAFKAYRVPMGVYEQREDGQFMVRVRIAAGVATPRQLRKIAELSRTHGNGTLHVTTRQDIQIHNVELENVADIHESLLEVGLSARGGGGNTVRNVSASPRAGVDPEEVFDVRSRAISVAEYLLQFNSSYNLPRKYKIAFSGTETDTAFASVADLGFFARIEDSEPGFCVYAGGGLGNKPRLGVLIEKWISADDVLYMAEAVKQVFDEHGDRSNKNAARLRYVVSRLGEELFAETVRERFATVRSNGFGEGIVVPEVRPLPSPYEGRGNGADLPPSVASTAILPEARRGFYSIELSLLLGDIAAANLTTIARLSEKYGEGLVRTSQQQNLFLTAIPGHKVAEVIEQLRSLPGDLLGEQRPHVTACAGASTCRLGLCLSRNLALAIDVAVTDADDDCKLPPIRISGCPNSCANHHVAAIGLEGKARRIEGRLMPYYEILYGGQLRDGKSKLASRLGALPAKVLPDMLLEFAGNGDDSAEVLQSLVKKYEILPSPAPDEFYVDWGTDKPFSLAGRGPGECSVGTMDIIRVDIDAARVSLKAARDCDDVSNASEHIYQSLTSAARSLMPVYGLEPAKDRELLRTMVERLVLPGWVAPEVSQLVDAALDWRMGDAESLESFLPTVAGLVERLEVLFASLDASLNFRVEPLVTPVDNPASEEIKAMTHESDLRGVACPMNFVKAKVALESIPVGDVLAILLDHGEPASNVPDSFAGQGQEVLSVDDEGGLVRVRIKRTK